MMNFDHPGGFFVGCNYWASHAGTAMWTQWDPDVVDADFRGLAEAGLRVVRVFPLWPDFQPLHLRRGVFGESVDVALGDAPLPDTPAGRAGVSEAMLARFAALADLAQAHGLTLIVGLVTGWMSGRLFVPPALEGRNVITDPFALMWQVRFVRHFVARFRAHPAMGAWDLGNECNVLGSASREAAWVWTNTITQAIRAEDLSRPVISGMAGLHLRPGDAWPIADQAELTDVLTTHPYPPFTPHCDLDPINTRRPGLHATAESRLFGDIGGKPCFAEEVGTLGPMFAGEAVAADYARTTLFSLWTHDCHGLLWWCAYDQTHLDFAPYDWCPMEQELGLFSRDRAPKPVADELTRFGAFVDGLPFGPLPPRITEGVCLLSGGQDHWAVAYNAFILAKQAGADITFQAVGGALRPAPVYLLPCVSGMRTIRHAAWNDLLARVREGATLYVSHADGFLTQLKDVIGAEVQTRERRPGPVTLTLEDDEGDFTVTSQGAFRLSLRPDRAEVLGKEPDGSPAFLRASYGAGTVYFLATPLEMDLALRPGAYDDEGSRDAWRVYRRVFANALGARIAAKDVPDVGITEHPMSAGERVIALVNYGPESQQVKLTAAPGWQLRQAHYGKADSREANVFVVPLRPNDAFVATFSATA